jgi:hypothetical protein
MFSSHRAMGLTAMKPWLVVTVIVHAWWCIWGAVHERNCLVTNISFEHVWIAMQHLIDDEKLRTNLQRNAIHDICSYFPEQAAINILNVLFKG